MTREELGIAIYDTSHITGSFLLRSGQRSNEYFDKYLFESDPELLNEIAAQLSGKIPAAAEMLGGLEMGGIPIAALLSQHTKLPAVFVRKQAKEYGTCKLAEGSEFRGRNVCIVEDVVTTGGQIIKSATQLRELGAVVDTVVCVIVRNPKAFDNLSKVDLRLVPLFTMDELKKIKGID